MRGKILDDDMVLALSKQYGKTPAQVVLRWAYQNDIVIIPKSITPSRIEENFNVFDFLLSDEDMAGLDGLNRDERIGPDPDYITF